MTQTALLCGCGAPLEPRTTAESACALLRCTKCERRARLSRELFGGLREAAFRRDESQCQVCGCPEASRLVLHHRRPGRNALSLLVTLCRACHVRVHHTARPTFVFVTVTPFLFRLWREVHHSQPLQLLLAAPKEGAEQRALFERADTVA